MEELEVLKQENAKLNARLNKAIEVFKEQKANLDNLTAQVTERDAKIEKLQHELNAYENSAKVDNTADIELVSKYEELQKQYDEVVKAGKELAEELVEFKVQNGSLNKQLNEYELKLQKSETDYKELTKEKNELLNQIGSITSESTKIAEEYAKVTLSLENYKKGNAKLIEEKKQLEEKLEARLQQIKALENTMDENEKKIISAQNEWINKYRELEKTVESKDKAHKLLQETYNSVFNELNNLKETNTKNINLYNELKKNYEQQKEGCQKLEDACVNKDKEIETLKKDLADSLLQLEHSNQYKQFAEAVDELLKSSNIITKTKNIENKDTSKKITVTKHTNSTGSQFMTDASGMNI